MSPKDARATGLAHTLRSVVSTPRLLDTIPWKTPVQRSFYTPRNCPGRGAVIEVQSRIVILVLI